MPDEHVKEGEWLYISEDPKYSVASTILILTDHGVITKTLGSERNKLPRGGFEWWVSPVPQC